MFEALNEEADDNMDDAMVDDAAASKPAKRSKPTPVTQTPVVEEHEGIDVDDDIT